MRLDKAVAGVDVALVHQRQKPLNALGVAPVIADMERKGPVDDLVVGIGQKPRDRRRIARIVGIGQQAQPAVCALPSGRRHSPLGAVAGVARRHLADHLERNALGIGQHQVLRGRDVKRAGRDPLLAALRPHQAHGGCHRGVIGRKRRPGQRRRMPGRGDAGQIVMAAGQDRTRLGPAQRQRHRRRILDLQDRAARGEVARAVRREVLLWVIRVDPFDHDVLIVQR